MGAVQCPEIRADRRAGSAAAWRADRPLGIIAPDRSDSTREPPRMQRRPHAFILAASAACLLLPGCAKNDSPARKSAAEPRHLNVLVWSDYLAPEVIPEFERRTGIRVTLDYVDGNATLDAKLLAGNTGYDVVFPTGSFLARQVSAGVYLPLDRSRLGNLAQVDAAHLRRLEIYDPGNRHGVPTVWGTHGLAVDVAKVRARLPDAALDSWALVFDPVQAAMLADCGIAAFDSPHFMTTLAYLALGVDPASESAEDLARVDAGLRRIRPFIRKIDNSAMINDLAAEEVCVSVLTNLEYTVARDRVREAGRPFGYRYVLPREGTTIWYDVAAIPADAPSPAEAHAFLDFLMDPAIAAANSNFVGAPNAVPASRPLLRRELTEDPSLYPPPEVADRLYVDRMPGPEAQRARARAWTRFVADDYR